MFEGGIRQHILFWGTKSCRQKTGSVSLAKLDIFYFAGALLGLSNTMRYGRMVYGVGYIEFQ